jgi:hypothetical protein
LKILSWNFRREEKLIATGMRGTRSTGHKQSLFSLCGAIVWSKGLQDQDNSAERNQNPDGDYGYNRQRKYESTQ